MMVLIQPTDYRYQCRQRAGSSWLTRVGLAEATALETNTAFTIRSWCTRGRLRYSLRLLANPGCRLIFKGAELMEQSNGGGTREVARRQ